jgi:hypothetical protein
VPAAFAASLRFAHSNGPHLLHRKRERVSYKILLLEGNTPPNAPQIGSAGLPFKGVETLGTAGLPGLQ